MERFLTISGGVTLETREHEEMARGEAYPAVLIRKRRDDEGLSRMITMQFEMHQIVSSIAEIPDRIRLP